MNSFDLLALSAPHTIHAEHFGAKPPRSPSIPTAAVFSGEVFMPGLSMCIYTHTLINIYICMYIERKHKYLDMHTQHIRLKETAIRLPMQW